MLNFLVEVVTDMFLLQADSPILNRSYAYWLFILLGFDCAFEKSGVEFLILNRAVIQSSHRMEQINMDLTNGSQRTHQISCLFKRNLKYYCITIQDTERERYCVHLPPTLDCVVYCDGN
jgi:hypothetical protein